MLLLLTYCLLPITSRTTVSTISAAMASASVDDLQTNLHCVSKKNAPTFASCNFNQVWTNFDIFLVNSISTISKVMCVFNFSSPFYLLYLLLNSCDGNDAFYAHETVQLLQQEILDFISPDLCLPNSLVDPETQSTTEFGD